MPADIDGHAVIENFDQSPFHINEVGSKSMGTLSIRGGGTVVLKEGHAATRERWTANATVSSRPGRLPQPPPLQLMFRVEGRGPNAESTFLLNAESSLALFPNAHSLLGRSISIER